MKRHRHRPEQAWKSAKQGFLNAEVEMRRSSRLAIFEVTWNRRWSQDAGMRGEDMKLTSPVGAATVAG